MNDRFGENAWIEAFYVQLEARKAIRHWRAVERERWGEREWSFARELADTAWELHPAGYYLFDAQKACEHVHFCRTLRAIKEATPATAEPVVENDGWRADQAADVA